MGMIQVDKAMELVFSRNQAGLKDEHKSLVLALFLGMDEEEHEVYEAE